MSHLKDSFMSLFWNVLIKLFKKIKIISFDQVIDSPGVSYGQAGDQGAAELHVAPVLEVFGAQTDQNVPHESGGQK